MMTMKKLARALTLTFSLSMAVSLVACGGEEPAPPVFDESSPAASQPTEPEAGQPAGQNTEPMSCEETCEWGNGHACYPQTIDCTALCQKVNQLLSASGCTEAYNAVSVCLGKHSDQLTCENKGICVGEMQAYGVCVSGYCKQNPTACKY
jgi:hypothetical protein